MPTSPSAEVGANVRAEMARRDVSQVKIAENLGMSQAAISSRLRGRTPFDINELAAIADYLEMPISGLLPAERASA